MKWRSWICGLLIASLLMVALCISPVAVQPAKAQVSAIALGVYTLLKTGFSVLKFLTGNTPAQKDIEMVNAQIGELQAIVAEEAALQAQMQQILNDLGNNNLYQAANSYVGRICDYWGDSTTTAGDKSLLGFAKAGYGNVSGATMKDFAERVMQTGDDSIEVGVEAFHQALMVHPPGSPNNGIEQGLQGAFLDLGGQTVKSDMSATVQSTNNVPIVAERPMYFNFQNMWSGGHCVTGAKQPGKVFYFAEGTVRPTFASFLCIQNPGGGDAQVKITYMRGNGATKEQALSIGGHSRATVNVADVLGRVDSPESDFSAKVESVNDVPILAERPMFFNYGGKWTGGHCEIGATAPSNVSYLAEGSTRPGFDTFLCLQNPGDSPANALVTYMKADGSVARQSVTIGAHTRSTLKANDVLGSVDAPACDFSTRIESSAPIVAERAMYFNYRGIWTGGSSGMGQKDLRTDYYFAEGTTRPGFDSYLCLQNPNDIASQVKVTYMRGDGTSADQSVVVPAHSRSTVRANSLLGSADSEVSDFSAHVHVTNGIPIVAERPMYFDYHGNTGGHSTGGTDAPANTFYFAEGTVRPEFSEYICIQNPNDRPSDVKITYMKGDGSTEEQFLTVGPRTRSTVNVGATASVTLLKAYQDNLGTLFSNCLVYQSMGALEVCNARDYDPARYGTSTDYMNMYYNHFMAEETDSFLEAVDTLVMSQANATNVSDGHPALFELPSDSATVFSSADWLARQALNQGTGTPTGGPYTTLNLGITGRYIASQDVVPPGTMPVLKAQKHGTTTTYDLSPTSVNANLNWVDTNYNQRTYDCWTADATPVLSLSGQWSMVRFAFDNVPTGTYDIIDSTGKALAQNVTVTSQSSDGYTIISCSPAPGFSPPEPVISMTRGGPQELMKQNSWSSFQPSTPSNGNLPDPSRYMATSDRNDFKTGIFMDIDHQWTSAGPYEATAYMNGPAFKVSSDLDAYVRYEMDLYVEKEGGSDWDSHKQGFCYVKCPFISSINGFSYSSFHLYLVDQTDGNKVYDVNGDSAKRSIDAAQTTSGGNDRESYDTTNKPIGSYKFHFKAGHVYNFKLQNWGKVDGTGIMQCNGQTHLTGVRILGY